ncbi:MAG: PhzF family phenazine biosynthesis protein [FCB group bacterium]|nr:PhzF family phenazine biosynthesis protein [FCB group bacterium]
MKIPFYQIDAFTSSVFGGNPAAVCPLDDWIPDDLMQKIAMENNLSETAFFVRKDDHFHIRWFSPTIEVNLCGHATLATAFVLFNHLNYDSDVIHFHSAGGSLKVHQEGTRLILDFPSTPAKKIETSMRLVHGLGEKPEAVFKSRDILAVFDKEVDIHDIHPNFSYLKELDCLGIIATAPGDEVDFVSRFFAPAAGVDEDPVTGSAHTTLIPYWSERLNKNQLLARQISQRGGELFCELRGDRVFIGGNAVTYAIGHIQI